MPLQALIGQDERQRSQDGVGDEGVGRGPVVEPDAVEQGQARRGQRMPPRPEEVEAHPRGQERGQRRDRRDQQRTGAVPAERQAGASSSEAPGSQYSLLGWGSDGIPAR